MLGSIGTWTAGKLIPIGVIGLMALSAKLYLNHAVNAADARGYERHRIETNAAAAIAERRMRTAEVATLTSQKEASDEAQRMLALDRARRETVLARVASADQRLQRAVDATVARDGPVPSGAGIAGERQAATAVRDVLGACRRALQQLGRDADEELAVAFSRHGECVGRYEAVRRGQEMARD